MCFVIQMLCVAVCCAPCCNSSCGVPCSLYFMDVSCLMLQMTQPTNGGAVPAVTNCCENCVET